MKEQEAAILEPVAENKETEYNRAQRRKMEKHAFINSNRLRRRNKLITDMKLQAIQESINSYKKSYNEYITSSHVQNRKLESIDVVMGLETIHAPFDEIASQVESPERLEKSKIEGTNLIRLRYLRIDFVLNHIEEIEARPGVPEKVELKPDGTWKKEQLFYHAIMVLETEAKENEIDADTLLITDLHTHLICMGIDMQQMNNNKLWNNKLHVQTTNLQAKADEVNKIFSKIGDNAKEK